MATQASKFQKFDMDTISRDQIHGAEYNPRIISEDAKKRLRKMLAKHGLVQPLVWNRRTGNLVSGHQRLAALDSLEKSKNYDLLVAVVDVSEREERVLNVQLNNPDNEQQICEMTNVNNCYANYPSTLPLFFLPHSQIVSSSTSCTLAVW